jgi:hypothetical protein
VRLERATATSLKIRFVLDGTRAAHPRLRAVLEALEELARCSLGEQGGRGAWARIGHRLLPEPAPLVEAELPLDPQVTVALRERASEGRKVSTGNGWRSLDTLQVVLLWPDDGAQPLLLSDGLVIALSAGGGALLSIWDVRRSAALAPLVERLTSDLKDPELPRLRAVAVLDRLRTLWVLQGYGSRGYEAVPVLLQADRDELLPLPLAPASQAIGGSEPKLVLGTDDPDRFLLRGTVDAGAMFHLDEFIDVPTSYLLDLRNQCSRSVEGPTAVRPLAPFVACAGSQQYTEEGQSWRVIDSPRQNLRVTRTLGALEAVGPENDWRARLPDHCPEIALEKLADVLIDGVLHRGRAVVRDLTRFDRLVARGWNSHSPS